ncbi:putative serine/threonine-protein kinase receptor [Zingiber officinale]|uniref:putative serine/threonine-protein kinase receptor n=1 Tax=Zingiber officinale TaxID=94328 RepID=UPI001C4BD517|nr:putative serine/threonine-protein kinase receptor [Zingiber officinale]
MCVCLQGFQPKNLTNWDLIKSWSDGCLRKTDLDCRNTTDGFFTQSSVKPPDMSTAVMNTSLTLEECGSLCLNDCNCTAYTSANVTGSGCIRWNTQLTDIKFFFGRDAGQDLFVRLAAADLIEAYSESSTPRRRRVGLIVAVTLVASFLLSIAAFCIWKWKSKSISLIPRNSQATPSAETVFFSARREVRD